MFFLGTKIFNSYISSNIGCSLVIFCFTQRGQTFLNVSYLSLEMFLLIFVKNFLKNFSIFFDSIKVPAKQYSSSQREKKSLQFRISSSLYNQGGKGVPFFWICGQRVEFKSPQRKLFFVYFFTLLLKVHLVQYYCCLLQLFCHKKIPIILTQLSSYLCGQTSQDKLLKNIRKFFENPRIFFEKTCPYSQGSYVFCCEAVYALVLGLEVLVQHNSDPGIRDIEIQLFQVLNSEIVCTTF